tara:strand:+ start:3562 stop:4296 length:735 start_codon:yes stop_codon:yes gene_type:complete
MYGICLLTVIPMRNKPSHKSEMINQILFGESFKILKQKKNWVYIKLSHDNYTGWICNKQYQKISKRKIESYTLNQKNYSIKIKGDRQQIVLGSFLPKDELFKKKLQLEFNLNYYKSKNSSLSLPKIAKKYLNSPYLWGGRTNLGIDCSGFTQIVYRFFSINLPRDSHQQAKKGELIKFKNCKSGDLAFFEEKNKINHVGIVLPRNNIIHSSGKVRIDQFDNKGIFNSENKKYSHKLKLIKRVTL